MGQINNLSSVLKNKFSERVSVLAYNVYYDDTHEVASLIEQISHRAIRLPAVFIDNELSHAGHIDEARIIQALKNRGLKEV